MQTREPGAGHSSRFSHIANNSPGLCAAANGSTSYQRGDELAPCKDPMLADNLAKTYTHYLQYRKSHTCQEIAHGRKEQAQARCISGRASNAYRLGRGLGLARARLLVPSCQHKTFPIAPHRNWALDHAPFRGPVAVWSPKLGEIASLAKILQAHAIAVQIRIRPRQ